MKKIRMVTVALAMMVGGGAAELLDGSFSLGPADHPGFWMEPQDANTGWQENGDDWISNGGKAETAAGGTGKLGQLFTNTLTVTEMPIKSFKASPASVLAAGDTVTLSWEVIGADSFSVDQGVGNLAPLSIEGVGSTQIVVNSSTTYTLTAVSGSGTDTAVVNVPKLKVAESELSLGLTWAGVACSDPDYTLWGASPIVSDDGKVHLFIARWPQQGVEPAWHISCEIAHYVADHPEGPFVFSDVAMQGTGVDGDWDKYAPHNPEIQRFGDLYVLCYIGNPGSAGFPVNQRTGMATAPSPYGPWTKVGATGQILFSSTAPSHFTYNERLVNPSLLKVGDLYHLYFKTRYGGGNVYGVATSANVTGPYVLEDDPITPAGITIEDACSFMQDGKAHLLTTDNHGHVTGIAGGGALWVSDDGFTVTPGSERVGFRTLPDYYEDYDPTKVLKVYGSTPKMERPKVLMLNGRPRYLYGPSGWNMTGEDRTVVHVLRIENPPAETTKNNLLQNGDFELGSGVSDMKSGDTPDD